MNPKIILVEPEIPENTGFIARLAANFEYDLRIVEPEFNLSKARNTASNAQDKLREAEIYGSAEEAVEDLGIVVGTKPGRGRPVKDVDPGSKVSIMIGRESSGLSGEELELCDTVVHIDAPGYDSLNQSHAAAVTMHSLKQEEDRDRIDPGMKQALRDKLPESVSEAVLSSYPSKDKLSSILGDL